MYFFVSLLFVGCSFIFTNAETDNSSSKFVNVSERYSKCKTSNKSIYDFKVTTLNYTTTDLSEFKGHVLLVINVATFCAYTQQYLDFNKLLEKYEKKLHILAFPCNQFLLQEPAENHEIMNGILYVRPGNNWKPHSDLHIFGKLAVNGNKHHPLYEFLKDSCPQTILKIGNREELFYNPINVNDITWNFEKFLIDKNGTPRYRFHPSAWNSGKVVAPYIEELLNE